MEAFELSGSNVYDPEEPLHLKIVVSEKTRLQYNIKNICLSLDNEGIIPKDEIIVSLQKDEYTGGKKLIFTSSNDHKKYNLDIYGKKYCNLKYPFILLVKSSKKIDNLLLKKIIIDFETGKSKYSLHFTVVKSSLKIQELSVTPNIVQKNISEHFPLKNQEEKTIKVKYKINKNLENVGDSLQFKFNDKIIESVEVAKNNTTKKIEKTGEFQSSIDLVDNKTTNYLSVQVKKGKAKVHKTVSLTYVNATQIYNRKLPSHKNTKGYEDRDYAISNFCASQDGKTLFSIFCDVKDINNKTFYLGVTNEIDGDNWELFKIKDNKEDNKDIIMKKFANSPMVHLKTKAEDKYGKLVFIGGSKLGFFDQDEDSANKVAIIALNTIKDNEVFIEMKKMCHEEKEMNPIWGHTCIVYNDYTIYRFGGQNQYGELQKKVWTSIDGEKWTLLKNEWNITAGVLSSACVEVDKNNEKHLWLTKGLERFGKDKLVPEIYKWQEGKPKVITIKGLDDKIKDKEIKALGIGYTSLNKEATALVLIAYTKGGLVLLHKIIKDDNGYMLGTKELKGADDYFQFNNSGSINTVTCFGCLWFSFQYSEGDKGINNYKNLSYYIPELKTKYTE